MYSNLRQHLDNLSVAISFPMHLYSSLLWQSGNKTRNIIYHAHLDGYDIAWLDAHPIPTSIVGITIDNSNGLGTILVTDQHKRRVTFHDHSGTSGSVVTYFEDLSMPVAVDEEYVYWYSNMFRSLYRAEKHSDRSEPQLLVRDIGWVGDFKIAMQRGKG